ncbi:glycosyltransferase family 4 protein [Aeromonas caviae]|nr:glycosyltransferase family 4 protein [Aeromonas caviae]
MKVCFFIGNLNLSGGTERVATVIANKLQLSGYSVHILSLQCGDKPFFEVMDEIQVSQLFTTEGRGLFRFPITIFKLRNFLKKNKIDVLIDVESMLSIYAIPAVAFLNLRHICWEHFNYHVDLGKKSRRMARKLAAHFADDVVTLTERDRQLWLINTKSKVNMIAIPNPVTIELPLESNYHKEKIFLAVGRLSYQKGFDLLLQAWAHVAHLHPDWRLRIVGDGEEKLKLEKMRQELNIEASTELIPNTNRIALHYQESAFFVMSSRFEGFGLVLVEAQSYGLPIISFDCDFGPSEIITNHKNGWLCEKEDGYSLGEALSEASAIFNTDAYFNMSQSAILSSKRYSLDKVFFCWDKLLNEKR